MSRIVTPCNVVLHSGIRKAIGLLLVLFLVIGGKGWGQVTSLWTNPITGTNPNSSNPYTTGDTKNTNVTVSGIGRGSGITGTNANDRYNAQSWNNSALDANDYFSFTLTPASGYRVSYSSFVYTGQASGTGPTSTAFRSNAASDNYATNIGSASISGTTISLSASAYQNVTNSSPVSFRFFAWGGTGGTFSINDFTFNGSILGSATTSLSGFTYAQGAGPSTAQSFTVNGAGLTTASATVTITGSTNYEVSTTSSTTGFGSSATLTASSGNISGSTVWVRLKAGLSQATYNSETITIGGGGVTGIPISCSGSVSAPANSTVSDIITANGETSNINYASKTGSSFTANTDGIKVWSFTVRDGGATTDADALPTILSAVTITKGASNGVTSWASTIKQAALYDGSTKMGEISVTGETMVFTGLNSGSGVTAADGGTKTLDLYLTFETSSITDNQQFQFTILNSNVSTTGSTSTFSAFTAPVTSVTGDANRIEVTATKLLFVQQPSNTSINTGMSPAVTVQSTDANNNRDLDYTIDVTMTSTGTLSGTPVSANTVTAGLATFTGLTHTATGTGLTLTAASSGLTNIVSNSFDITNPQPEINIKQNTTSYASGGTYAFGNQVSGTSSSAITFTIENLGTADLNISGSPKVVISGTHAAEFTINETSTAATVAASGTTTFTITFSPTSQGAKTAAITITNDDADESSYTINLTGTGTVSAASDITIKSGYTFPTNIAYKDYQSTNIINDANSIEIAQFTIRDGGATTDADNLGTTLSQVVFSVSNSSNIRRIALYDGTTEIGTEQAGASTVTFSGLSLTAADGSTKDFSVRVSFNSTVTDNQQVQLTVAATTSAASTGSGFAATNAGAAVSSIAGNNNRIEVTADRLAFVQNVSDENTGVAMSPAPTVSANDANGNRDLDYVTSINITSSGTLSGTTVSATPSAGLATFSSLTHTATGTGLILTAASTGLTNATSNTFTISAVPVTILTFDFEGLSGDETSAGSNFNFANTAASTITRGSGLTASGNGDRFNATSWATTSIANAVSGNDYMEFTITPNAGYQFSVSSIQFQIQRSATGLTEIALRSSANNYSTDLDAVKAVVDGTSTQSFTFTFTQATTSAAVTYRLYGYAEATGGSAGIGDFTGDDIVVMGNVSPGPAIALSNTGLSQFTTQNLTRSTTNTPISRFRVDVTTSAVTLSTLSFTTPNNSTTNSYVSTDISNFKLYYTTGTTFNTSTPVGGATTKSSGKSLAGSGETITFSGLTQTLAVGTYYVWVTGDILGTATAGRTLTVNAPTITASVGAVTGSTTATGTQSIIAAVATNYFLVSNNAGTASNWNTVADGSGTALSSLNNPTDVNLVVDNETAAFISGDISLGNNSKFIISQGTTAKLTISGCTVTATIDVGTAGTLDFFNSAAQQAGTTIGTLASGSTVEYSNTVNQTISRTINFSNLTISGAATKTAASGGAMQVTNNLTINNGGIFVLNGTNNLALTGTLTVATGATFDNGGESQITNSGGSINVSGTFITRDAQGFTGTNAAIPTIVPVLNAGSTVEYGLAGAQTITDFAYSNITFSNSGTKSTTGAVSSISGTVTIKDAAIVNVSNNTFGGTGTNLTMTGTSRLIVAGARQVPDMDGTYTLTGGTVEFAGNSASHTARGGASITYNNIEITGLNVNGSSGNYNIASGGSFTVATGARFSVTDQEVVAAGTSASVNINGTFQTSDADGFSGNANTSINATNITLTLGSSSTIEYARSGNQVLTPRSDYNNVTLSGSGIKDAASAFTVNGVFTLTGTASLGTTSPTFGSSSTLAYVNATDGVSYTGALEWPATNPPHNLTMNLSGASSPTLILPADRTIAGALALTAGTFDINAHVLTLNGTVAGAGLLKGSTASGISIGGTGALGTLNFDQTTDGTTNALNSLAYNRTGSGTFSLGNKLVIIDLVTPTAGTFTTGGFLHLRSTASNTARIAAGSSSGGYINGDVTVERYISASGNRAYRLITPSVNTSTSMNANWQEGQNNPDVFTNMPSASAAYGTHITGTGGGSNGFDATYSNAASLFRYNHANPSWDAVTSTSGTLSATTGYLLFVRGNRDDINVLLSSSPSSNTTLRAKGTLIQGNVSFNGLLGNTGFSLVTNPYASPILWDNTTGIYSAANNTSSFENYITIWDPNIGTRGGFVTVTTGNVTAGGATNLTNEIQSGQAFFVQAKIGVSAPSLNLLETHKSTTNNLNVYRNGTQTETLKTLLFYTDNTGTQRSADGVTSIFNNNYSNNVDGGDAMQIDNWDEDVAITRNGKLLSMEARALVDESDTIPLAIARMKAQSYAWKLVPQNFNAPTLMAYLKDNFTNINTAISLTDTTVVNFTVTADPLSKAVDRFSIIFKQAGSLPVTISNIKAYKKNSGVQVEWQVVNEINIDRYEIEKSVDGVHFAKLGSQLANGSTNYSSFDGAAVKGNNFYRIKIMEQSGKTSYTRIVKVNMDEAQVFVSLYPNPIVNNQVGLQLNNIPKGVYNIRIINSIGQTVLSKQLQHQGGSATQYLQLDATLGRGTYQVIVEGGRLSFVEQMIK